MSSWHQKSFVTAVFVTVFILISASVVAEGRHNLILIVPEALPADSIDLSNAPALTRLRRDGVSFANTYAGFPRLTAARFSAESSDIGAEFLLAAATQHYAPPLIVDDRDGAELQRLVTTTLPQARASGQPFFIVYRLKEPKGIDNSQGGNAVRPAFKPNPRPADTSLETIETTLKSLGLYETTNIVVAAEHGFSRVLKTSYTSHARALLPREENLGVLPAGFLAIDLTSALRAREPRLDLLDPDAGNSLVDWKNGGHPKQGNGLIAWDYEASKPFLTVEAHGVYDSIFFASAVRKDRREEAAQLIVEALQAQDYPGGVFVNERRVGLLPGALPMRLIARHGETEGLPDIVVIFASSRERCAPAEDCTAVVADTPLVEGEGIADVFSRAGTATFMAARGPDFRAGVNSHAPASNADMRRTIAELLDLDLDPADLRNARVLREVLTGGENRKPPQAASQAITSTRSAAGVVMELRLQTLGETTYLESAVVTQQDSLVAADEGRRPLWRLPRIKSFSISISDP